MSSQEIPSSELAEIIKEELNPLPIGKIKKVATIYAYTLAVLLAKGTRHFHSLIGLPSCSYFGNVLIIGHLIISLYMSWSIGR